MEADVVRDAMPDYLAQLEAAGAKANTLLSYERDLKKFCTYLETAGEGMSAAPEAYRQWLEARGYASASVARNLAAMKGFLVYLEQEKGLMTGEITLIPPRIIPVEVPPLSMEEVVRLLMQPDADTVLGLRDKAMLELMYATGIRVGLLLKLKVSDINLRSGYLKRLERGRHRIIPIRPRARDAVAAYIEIGRPQLTGEAREIGEDILFLNSSGCPMSRQGFWKILKRYASQAGIRPEVTPQMLAASFAVHIRQPEEEQPRN